MSPSPEHERRKNVIARLVETFAVEQRVELAPAPGAKGKWRTAMKIDPFAVPLAAKAQLLLDLWPLVKDGAA